MLRDSLKSNQEEEKTMSELTGIKVNCEEAGNFIETHIKDKKNMLLLSLKQGELLKRVKELGFDMYEEVVGGISISPSWASFLVSLTVLTTEFPKLLSYTFLCAPLMVMLKE